MNRIFRTLDGNEACASVAYRLAEVIAIYPITPASPMGEHADAWADAGQENLWGEVPRVVEMQSESGAAGAVHGAVQAGALSTTFTASQGLLLMVPNLYKIAGELTPAVIHVAARTVATHALSIFGDHSDVMAARATGLAMLASASVQEAQDLALIAHAATLESRVPFLHFFDGFRTSHEVSKIEALPDEVLRAMIDDAWVYEHRQRALDPDRPVLRGSAQNPDVFFQAREAVNPFYEATPGIVERAMSRLGELTGRRYRLFDYVGHPRAERVVVAMGSGAETVTETVRHLASAGEKVGAVTVRLFRPFSISHFVAALPDTVRQVAVLDRTKEPGAPGEPLYLDVTAALSEARPGRKMPEIFGGRYGLSSKELTPAMILGLLDAMHRDAAPRHFTLGIVDDVTGTSIPPTAGFEVEPEGVYRALFYGLGSDGTVGANKNTIKIIGEETENAAQGYFVYDSKKSGATTVSHLRFGPEPIHAPYLIDEADLVACHHPVFLERTDILRRARRGGTFLLATDVAPKDVFHSLPASYQKEILDKDLKVYAVDAAKVAGEAGLGKRINTVMQTAFFEVSKVLPLGEAVAAMKRSAEKTYGKKDKKLAEMNARAIDAALGAVREVAVPDAVDADHDLLPAVPEKAPEFVQRVTARILEGEGDLLPVSAFPPDGTFPTGTARFEKRNIADEIPVWKEALCIQCNKCAMVCPHAAIRAKAYDPANLEGQDVVLPSLKFRGRELPDGWLYTIQTSPEDCTGCGLCVEACPAVDKLNPGVKSVNMVPKAEAFEVEKKRWEVFVDLPEIDRSQVNVKTVKGSQLIEPLFEFSGACSGCGETPYLKLLTQLFGDRMLVANATGCSSIYGGNLPTTPWAPDPVGHGPAWANSLFEDNAEFGLGMRLAVDARRKQAEELVKRLSGELPGELVEALLAPDPTDATGYAERRSQIASLRSHLGEMAGSDARLLAHVCETLLPRSVWIVGGDGWAYDIGYGGLDHVLASGENVNVIVLDSEVYSNTGGQASKATPKGAVAKFASGGKRAGKKDLALMAMAYGNVYVGRIAMGASDAQTVKILAEAEAYPGPSLVLAYAACIAHGLDLGHGLTQQKLAVKSGYWPLLHYDPRRVEEGKSAMVLDSKPPSVPLSEFEADETRFRSLTQSRPEIAARLEAEAQAEVEAKYRLYQLLATPPAGKEKAKA